MGNQKLKSCEVCGRTIEWRKKWARSWDAVKFCSDRCRSRKKHLGHLGAFLESQLVEALKSRARDQTISPSQIFAGHEPLTVEMKEQIREAARRLAVKGEVEILERGKIIEPSAFKGDIQLRLRR